MATRSTCSIGRDKARAVTRAELQDPGGVLAAIARRVQETVDASTESWATQIERAQAFLRRLGQGDIVDNLTLLVEEGVMPIEIKQGVDLASGVISQSVPDKKRIGALVSAYKHHIGGLGQGLQLQAVALGRKVAAGQDVAADALQYARQARGIAKMYDFVLQQDLADGRNMRIRQLERFVLVPQFLRKYGDEKAAELVRITKEQNDFLTRAVELINAGKVDDGVREILKHAEFVKLFRSPEHALRATSKLHTWGDMIWTLAVEGLLSSPRTWVVNAASATNGISRPFFQLAGSKILEAAGSIPGLGLENSVAGARKAAAMASAEIVGQLEAYRDAFRLGWSTVRTGDALYGGQADYQAYMEMFQGGWNAANLKRLGLPLGSEGSTAWKVADGVGKVVTIPGSFLQGGDDFTKHLVLRGKVRAEAVREVIEQEGFDMLADRKTMEEAFARHRVAAFNMAAPDMRDKWQLQTTYDHYHQVFGAAKEATFQEDTAASRALNKLRYAPVLGQVLRTFMPFQKTPINIMKQGFLDSTPLGLVIRTSRFGPHDDSIRGVLRIQQAILNRAMDEPDRFAMQIGQAAFFTALAGTVYGMVTMGELTGGGPRRWDNRAKRWQTDQGFIAMRQAQGFSTGRYELKVGGLVMSLDRLGEPFAMPMKMVADVAEMAGYMSESEQDEYMSFITYIMMTGAFQGSFLEGVQNLLDLILVQDDPGNTRLVEAAQGAASVYMPFSGMLGYLTQVDDPYREVQLYRDSSAWWQGVDQFWNGLTERIRMRMPGNGNNPDLIDPVFGEKVPIYPGIGPENTDLIRLTIPFAPTGARPKDSLYEKIFRLVGPYTPPSTQLTALTPGEQMRLNEIQGKEVFLNGMSKAQAIEAFMRRPDVAAYMRTPYGMNQRVNPRIEGEFRKLDRRYFEAALGRLRQESPDLEQRVAIEEFIATAENQNDTEAIKAGQAKLKDLFELARIRQSKIPGGYAPGMVLPEQIGGAPMPVIPGR